MKSVFGVVGIVVGVLLLMWAVVGNEFFLYRYFAPKFEEVRRETFEETKSYRQGMVQELQNMQFEYERSTPEQKVALRSIVLHRAADVPDDALTSDLRKWLSELRRQR